MGDWDYSQPLYGIVVPEPDDGDEDDGAPPVSGQRDFTLDNFRLAIAALDREDRWHTRYALPSAVLAPTHASHTPTPDPYTDEMKARATGLSLAEIRALREENW